MRKLITNRAKHSPASKVQHVANLANCQNTQIELLKER